MDFVCAKYIVNPFGTNDMAAGYAVSRPPVHSRVLEQVRLLWKSPVRRALDIGCGAGLSTKALTGIADHCIGLEPAEAMLRWTATVAPQASFLVGAAETIPLRARSIDLITAAGSLNYVNLDLFFPEARRVLTPRGSLIV
ncbi:MAG: methyltransferase domain-containing protein [Bryobacteraceae bacterium]